MDDVLWDEGSEFLDGGTCLSFVQTVAARSRLQNEPLRVSKMSFGMSVELRSVCSSCLTSLPSGPSP